MTTDEALAKGKKVWAEPDGLLTLEEALAAVEGGREVANELRAALALYPDDAIPIKGRRDEGVMLYRAIQKVLYAMRAIASGAPLAAIPILPTKAMIEAATQHIPGGSVFTEDARRDIAKAVYRAMLAAAEKQP